MATTIPTKPPEVKKSATLVSRLSMGSSVAALLIALADITAVLIIHFFALAIPSWANEAQQIVTQSAVLLGTVGVLLNLLEAATILARHEQFDPHDASKQYAIDDAEAILARFERGCLMRVTVPLGLIMGLASLLLGLLPLPGLEGLQVLADNAPQTCSTSSGLAPFSLQVVNSSSTVSVGWSAQPVEKVGGSQWAQIEPSSGTLAPAHRTTVQVIPNVLLCQFVTQRAAALASVGHGYAAQLVSEQVVSEQVVSERFAQVMYHVMVTDAHTHHDITVGMVVLNSSSGPTPTPAPTATPTATPTPTPTPRPTPTPSPTPIPVPPARLSVSPSGTTAVNCFGSSVAYPKITIGNTGGKTLNWSASTTVAGASLSPSSGAVAPGGSQQVGVSQGGLTSTATNVTISSNGGNATVSFACIPPSASLKVTQNQNASQTCTGNPANAYTVTLDNTGSNVSVAWQFNPAGAWANASAANGTIGAGQTATFQVAPTVCPTPGTTAATTTGYQATLALSFPQGGSQANPALADAITGPPPNIAGCYNGSFTTFGFSGTSPMQLQLSQSYQSLSGTTTEGSSTANDTGTLNLNGSLSITEAWPGGGQSILVGSIVDTGHLAGTWNDGGAALGTWDVTACPIIF